MMLTGDNGILTRAGEAKEKVQESESIEKINLAIIQSIDGNGKLIASVVANKIQRVEMEKHSH